VERHPIQEAPPELWPTGDQVVHLRINDLQWQRLGQGRRAAGALSAHPNLKALSTISNPNVDFALCSLKLAKKDKILFSMLRQIGRTRATKGFSAPQIRQRLQKTCLPGGVGTTDQIKPRAQHELRIIKATKMGGPKQADHGRVISSTGA
jgi:hypothetical protein